MPHKSVTSLVCSAKRSFRASAAEDEPAGACFLLPLALASPALSPAALRFFGLPRDEGAALLAAVSGIWIRPPGPRLSCLDTATAGRDVGVGRLACRASFAASGATKAGGGGVVGVGGGGGLDDDNESSARTPRAGPCAAAAAAVVAASCCCTLDAPAAPNADSMGSAAGLMLLLLLPPPLLLLLAGPFWFGRGRGAASRERNCGGGGAGAGRRPKWARTEALTTRPSPTLCCAWCRSSSTRWQRVCEEMGVGGSGEIECRVARKGKGERSCSGLGGASGKRFGQSLGSRGDGAKHAWRSVHGEARMVKHAW